MGGKKNDATVKETVKRQWSLSGNDTKKSPLAEYYVGLSTNFLTAIAALGGNFFRLYSWLTEAKFVLDFRKR